MTSFNWHEELDTKSSNDSFNKFHDLLCKQIDKISPLEIVTCKPKPNEKPWETASVRRSNKKCKQLFSKTLTKTATTVDIDKYKHYRTVLNKVKRSLKMSYYTHKCIEFKSNSKKLWEIINKMVTKCNEKSSVIESLTIDNIRVYGSQQIADELAKYFASVGSTLSKQIGKPNKGITDYLSCMRANNKSMYFTPTDMVEIKDIIQNLPNKGSSGYDGISNKLIKSLLTKLTEPLVIVCNKSLQEGIFPDAMKHADVVPLHKSKSKLEKSNYRPISLLLTLSKILEKIVHTRTYSFLQSSDVLYAGQYGFREKHSCEHAISELVGQVVKNQTKGQHTAAVFLDLSKAFDTLNHEVLLKKLNIYGLRGTVYTWFKSYLENRTLRVKCIDNTTGRATYSKSLPITYGTPQGSCLGPLLFLIFTNDLHLQLKFTTCILFADDTTLYMSSSNENYLKFGVQYDLESLSDWFKANSLTLNLSKSECVFFTKTRKLQNWDLQLQLAGVNLPTVKYSKFLGVWIDNNLNWNKHVDILISKLKQKTKLISVSKQYLSNHCKRILYFAQFYSHLSYGILLWGTMCSKEKLKKLQRLQTNCVQLFTSINSSEALVDSQILSVKQIITLVNCKFMHDFLFDNLPKNIMSCLTTGANDQSLKKTHSYGTRNKHKLNIPKLDNSVYGKSYLLSTIREFETLPVVAQKIKIALCGLRWFKLNVSKCQVVKKMSNVK